MVAALALRTMGVAANPAEAEHNIVQALEAVALRLGNTRAVCRKYYVHPALLIAYHLGLTAPVSHAGPNKRRASSRAALRHDEQVVLQFLLESAAA
jgi:DNA topoisomerase-1